MPKIIASSLVFAQLGILVAVLLQDGLVRLRTGRAESRRVVSRNILLPLFAIAAPGAPAAAHTLVAAPFAVTASPATFAAIAAELPI